MNNPNLCISYNTKDSAVSPKCSYAIGIIKNILTYLLINNLGIIRIRKINNVRDYQIKIYDIISNLYHGSRVESIPQSHKTKLITMNYS